MFDPTYATVASETYKSSRRDLGNFIYDKNLSSEENSFYIDENTKQILIGTRGTKITSPFSGGLPNVGFKNTLKDLFSDVLIATHLEKLDPREHQFRNYVQDIQTSYPEYSISLIGHSLGGRLVMDVGRELNLPSYAFNPGSGPQDSLDRAAFGPSTHVFRTQNDFVSSFIPKNETSIVPTNPNFDAHTMTQFLVTQ